MSSSEYEDKPHFNVTFDDLHSPEGDYNEYYRAKSSLYNKYLVASFAFFVISAYTVIKLNA